jgi:hypothetical protein
VPVIFRGLFSEEAIERVISGMDFSKQEGFVVRTAEAFAEDRISTHMAKYVRPGHVQSETHWMQAELVRNGLAQ